MLIITSENNARKYMM